MGTGLTILSLFRLRFHNTWQRRRNHNGNIMLRALTS
jgi:hypothetical protein